MTFTKDLVAASATPLVLAVLKQRDSYGYEIIQTVKTLSGGHLEWAEGMLYPILHRLEKRGLIEGYWGKADSGRRRKYYRLMPQGAAVLSEQRAHWQQINTLLDALNGGELCST
ncbi:MAG: PadR family transcriptional regulator [Myxococcota bacterium]